jgi:hypothetical protein
MFMKYAFGKSLFFAIIPFLLTLTGNTQNFMVRGYPIPTDGPVNRGDFNEDGIPDVIFQTSTGIGVVLTGAQGTLGDVKSTTTSMSGGHSDLVVAKFTTSGHLDAAVTHPFAPVGEPTNIIDILLGHGDGTFHVGQVVLVPNGASADGLIAGDFDGDGNIDLAVTSGPQLLIFPGNGNATFDAPKTIAVDFHGSSDRFGEVVGDFDRDGRTDLALSDSGHIIVLFNTKNFTFQQKDLDTQGFLLAGLTATDINQDGYTDLLVGLQGFCPIKGPCQGGFAYYVSRGILRSLTPVFHTDPSAFAITPGGLTATDIDGDGINDIVGLVSLVESVMFVDKGLTNGLFSTSPQFFPIGDTGGVITMVVLDLNRDGRPDFVAPDVGDGSLLAGLNAFKRAACTASQVSPSITVCQPADNVYSNSPLHVVAKAVDNAHHVTSLQVYVDNKLQQSTTASTLDINLSLALGAHSLLVKAWDASGKSFRSNIHRVNIFSGTPGRVCSTVLNTLTICAPPQNANVASPVRILAAANTRVIFTSMQVYIDNKLEFKNDTTNYVNQTFTLSAGTHNVTVKCFDESGQKLSKSVTIQVH